MPTSLLQIPDHLMPVRSPVPPAAHVEPIVFAIGGFEDELVEVGVALHPVEPLAGGLEVGVAPVVVPGGIGGEREADVGSFAQGVLGGIGATNLDVELIASIAGADDDGPADEGAKGFEDLAAELLQCGDVLRGYTVVDVVLLCGGRAFELRERKMLR